MTAPDDRVELSNPQRYVLYVADAIILKLDTQTGYTWVLTANVQGQYWRPVAQRKEDLPPKEESEASA